MMSNFFVTLTSDPTKEFPYNTTSKFKNRLPWAIRLTTPGWKVGMASITLPDSQHSTSLLEEVQVPTAYPRLCQLGWFVLSTNIQYQSLEITKDTVEKRFGVGITYPLFLHAMVTMYQESKIEQAPAGSSYQHADDDNPVGKRGEIIDMFLTFKWTSEGDLLWDNSKTSPLTYQPRLNFTVSFAKKMGWLWYDGKQYHLGKNIEQVPLAEIRAPGDLNEYIRDFLRTGKKYIKGGRYWLVEQDQLMWLSDAISWKFLVPTLQKSMQHDQMLFVYSNLVQSSILNDKVVNLLSEVLYKKNDTGVCHFEPTTIRYLPLRSSILETIETHIEDSSGKKLDFRGIKTILNLHFTRDLLP